MSTEGSEFFEVGDKTALICDDSAAADTLKTILGKLDLKCHTAETSERAIERMKYTTYDLIVISETFAGSILATNGVLNYLAPLPMAQRRYTYFVLVGDSFRTLDAMQAYAQSVNLVVNPNDLSNLGAILKKGLTEFENFYKVYKKVLVGLGEA